MKIIQLHYFTTLAELQNVSKAAELLHISQSSLSKNIASMEAELGAALFERNGRHLTLNSSGQRFLEGCSRMLKEYEATLADISAASSGKGSRIKIGTCGSVNVLIPAMTEFKRQHPHTEYDVNTEIEADERVDFSAYDVLIYPDEPRYSKFNGYPIYAERFLLALHSSHPLSREAAVSAKSLTGLDLVFLRIGQKNEHVYSICSALSVQSGTQSFVTSRALQREAIASGLAAGFVPESLRTLYTSSPNITLIPITDGNFTRKYKIAFRRRKHLSALAQEFEDHVVRLFALGGEE